MADSSTKERRGLFPKTQWSLVARATAPSRTQQEDALNALLTRYVPALKVHLLMVKRLPPDQADDILQGFVLDKILVGRLLARAKESHGKFRTLLLTALDRYTISVFRKEQSQRRSPGEGRLISMASMPEEPRSTMEPMQHTDVFDLAWIREIIRETLTRVQKGCETTNKSTYWMLFKSRVVDPILSGSEPETYAELVRRLRFTTPMQAANALCTVKRMFERTFRSVVREYTGDECDVDLEISELRRILAESSERA